jgi:hypothetical protein
VVPTQKLYADLLLSGTLQTLRLWAWTLPTVSLAGGGASACRFCCCKASSSAANLACFAFRRTSRSSSRSTFGTLGLPATILWSNVMIFEMFYFSMAHKKTANCFAESWQKMTAKS